MILGVNTQILGGGYRYTEKNGDSMVVEGMLWTRVRSGLSEALSAMTWARE